MRTVQTASAKEMRETAEAVAIAKMESCEHRGKIGSQIIDAASRIIELLDAEHTPERETLFASAAIDLRASLVGFRDSVFVDAKERDAHADAWSEIVDAFMGIQSARFDAVGWGEVTSDRDALLSGTNLMRRIAQLHAESSRGISAMTARHQLQMQRDARRAGVKLPGDDGLQIGPVPEWLGDAGASIVNFMDQGGITSPMSRETKGVILKSSGYPGANETWKKLVDQGYVSTKSGNNGGSYLADKGKKLAKHL